MILILAMAFRAASAWADEAGDDFAIRPAGDAYFSWRQNWTIWYPDYDERRETTGDSQFDVERVRLGFDAHGADGFYDVRVLVAATRDPGDDEWRADPDHAWVRLNFAPAFYASVGLVPTSYIPFLDEAWRYRFIEKSAYEKWLYRRGPLVPQPVVTEDGEAPFRLVALHLGSPSETDLGVAVGGRVGEWMEWRVGHYNGEGAAHRETGGGKAVDGRLTVRPLARVEYLERLSITGAAWYEKIDADEEETLWRISGLLHYRTTTASGRIVNLGVETDYQIYRPFRDATREDTVHASVLSVFFEAGLTRRLALIGRADHFDPDRKNGVHDSGYKDEHSSYLLGTAFNLDRHVRFAVNLEATSYRRELIDDGGDNRIPDPELFGAFHLGLEL
ncbi:MAG: hypothetical protein H6684_13970 [Deltaproteobacteria bacterium]|nr:hypothetical protein [Deltaproteobacteria bacterium]